MKKTIVLIVLLSVVAVFSAFGAPVTFFKPYENSEFRIGDTLEIRAFINTLELNALGCSPDMFALSVSFNDGLDWTLLASINYLYGSGRHRIQKVSESVIEPPSLQDSTASGYIVSVRIRVNDSLLLENNGFSSNPSTPLPLPTNAIFQFLDTPTMKLRNGNISSPVKILAAHTPISRHHSPTYTSQKLPRVANVYTLQGRMLSANHYKQAVQLTITDTKQLNPTIQLNKTHF